MDLPVTTRRKITACVLLFAVSAVPAAQADPTDPPVPPGAPVPTAEQVVDVLNRITDPNISDQEKSAVVEPAFTPEDGPIIDKDLSRPIQRGYMPMNLVVTDIQPAPNNYAGATVSSPSRPHLWPTPIVLVKQGDQWKITEDTAMSLLYAIWHASRRRVVNAFLC